MTGTCKAIPRSDMGWRGDYLGESSVSPTIRVKPTDIPPKFLTPSSETLSNITPVRQPYHTTSCSEGPSSRQ